MTKKNSKPPVDELSSFEMSQSILKGMQMAITKAKAELEAAEANNYGKTYVTEVQFPRIILRTVSDMERDFSIDLHQIARSNGFDFA